MKNLILLFSFLISLGAAAQTKKVTATKRKANVSNTKKVVVKTNPVYDTNTFVFCRGYKFLTKEDGNYAVVQAPGYSQSELYKKMLVGISKLFKNPDAVITKVDNEMLTINGVETYCVREGKYDYSYKYNIQIFFKDNKIRIDAPTITGWKLEDLSWHSGTPVNYDYESIKSQHEKWMNTVIYAFFKSSFGEANEDW